MKNKRDLRYGQGRRLGDWPVSIRALIGEIYGRLSAKHGITVLASQCLASRMNNRILRAPNFAGIAESAVRLVNLRAPNFLVYSYVVGLCVVYAIVMVHIPMGINPTAGYDDNLFMSLGRYLSEGNWLGPFSQFTLMKGPGYPAFLALNNWLGIPVSLGQALFHCFAVTFFVATCHRFVRSHLISAIFLALLLWNPLSLSVWMLRVFRDEIYFGQTLLVLALMLLVLFFPLQNRRRCIYAALAGAVLGWFWLTREEGIWIVPALVFMALVATLHIFHNRWNIFRDPRGPFHDPRLRGLVVTLSIVIGVFSLTQVAFSSANWFAYDKFVGVDVKERNFQRAMGAIHSVRSGGTKPFVSITHATEQRVDAVSPAFASLAAFFDGPGKRWEVPGCAVIPSTCGEIASGWFMWALRDAAASTGHYFSPSAASAFFGRLADEISAACADKKLECKPQLIAEMPPISWPDVIRRLLPRYVDAFQLLILSKPSLELNMSVGTEAQLAPVLRFLNYPLHTSSAESLPSNIYTFSGWYYKAKDAWITAEARTPTGTVRGYQLERRGSPDVQQVFQDPAAGNQRFVLSVYCNDDCLLQLRTPDGEAIQSALAELRKTPIDLYLGKGRVHIESTDYQPNPEYTPSRFDGLCGHIRRTVMISYSWVFQLILAIGFIAFLVSAFVYWKRAIWNVCFVMTLVCWGLAYERTTLLLLIDSTSFPALHPNYLAPTYFLLISGAVLSIAAWFQLSQSSHRALEHAGVVRSKG